jgi:choline/glycine/proline betaine transport protein
MIIGNLRYGCRSRTMITMNATDRNPDGRLTHRPVPPVSILNVRVFAISVALIVAFSLFGVFSTETATQVFQVVQAWIVGNLGWYYVLAVSGFLLFSLVLAFSRYGEVRLGPDDCRPDYSYGSWFAMLFSAGMGIGLMFFGVAEPLTHFAQPPVAEVSPQSVEAARDAMRVSFLHWGLHAWAIYIVVGLALAYFGFRMGLPFTIRSTLFPLLGDRIHGRLGDLVDVFAIIGTVFGVATSLGFGAMQVNAGLNYLFGVPLGVGAQLLLIAAITLIATASVAAGLDAGIRRLSMFNMALAVLLVIFVLLAGPTVFLLTAWAQNTGSYLSEIVHLSFRQFAYRPTPWMGDWTLFYWDGGLPGRHSSGCSSRAFREDAPCANSCSVCWSCRRCSPFSG